MKFNERTTLYSIIVICCTVISALIFYSLWDYKLIVGSIFLAVFICFVCVYMRGEINEQDLRHKYYKHLSETPLQNGSVPLQNNIRPFAYPIQQEECDEIEYDYSHQQMNGYNGYASEKIR